MGLALALSLAAAVSLGITRFAYGLLLPPMRADLQWSYTLAGAMNTANAWAIWWARCCRPWLLRRLGASRLLLAGSAFASLFMGLSGFFIEAVPLLAAARAGRCRQRLPVDRRQPAGGAAGGAAAPARRPAAGPVLRRTAAWASCCRRCWCRPCSRPRATAPMAGPGPGGAWRWRAWRPPACWSGRRARCSACSRLPQRRRRRRRPRTRFGWWPLRSGAGRATRCSASATSAT